MRFLVDARLPPALARWLTEQAQVVWIRLGNTRRGLQQWFAPLLPSIEEALERGERLVEVKGKAN